MHVRKTTRRHLYRAGLLLVLVVLLAPKFELPALPYVTAVLNAAGLDPQRAG